MNRNYLFFALLGLGLLSCNKVEGPGGTSVLTGHVKSKTQQDGRPEITEIIFSPGLALEHGDYFLLNNLAGKTQYYIYYTNPEWISDANPNLDGRTGIAVTFNYSNSNVTVATNTLNAISDIIKPDFELELNVDILTFTSKVWGDAPDADKVTSPFEVNTAQQGKSTLTTSLHPAVDEKVYLVYGNQKSYGDMERTGGDGEYQFSNLTNGNYTVYAVLTNKTTGEVTKVEKSVEITDKKTVIEVPEIELIP